MNDTSYNDRTSLISSVIMHWSIHKKVLLGFGLSFLILLSIGMGLIRCFEHLVEAQERQTHSYQVIEKVKSLVTRLQDAQRGLRGYVITGDPAYLEPYFSGQKAIHYELRSLQQLTRDNLNQQKHLQQIEPKIQDEFILFSQILKARSESGFDSAVSLVKEGKGKRLMDEILDRTVQMESEERHILQIKNAELKQRTNSMVLTAIFGAIIILTIFGVLYYLIHKEIAQRKDIAAKLREREERLKFALDGTNDGLWDWDIVTGSVYFSPKWLEMIGYTQDELSGHFRTWEQLLHPDDAKRVRETLDAHLEGRIENYEAEMRLLTKTGDWKWILARGKVVAYDAYKHPLRMVGTHTDIHDKKRAEEAMLIAKEAATEAARLKSQFLANMSHEIRTPMHGVLGLTEMVLRTELSDEQRKNLEMVQSSGRALLTIINDILDFSKIEAGKLELDPIPFKLRESLEDILTVFSQQAYQKQVELLYRVEPDVPNNVMGDPSRLKQVLSNLIGNAVKFTSIGEILLDIKLEHQSENKVKLLISVSDTGIGLSSEQQEQIFEPFIQADGSTTRKYGGTGLGLSISKNLIELMYGKIWVQSEKGIGSKFFFTVELDLPETPVAPILPVDVQALRDMPVLIVDDNDTNLYILKEIVCNYGMRPVALNSGKEALEIALQAAERNEAFPLAILDVNMPEMDGFMLSQKIKSDSLLNATTIILLTSSGEVGDGAKCRKYGIDGYLTKPVGEQGLIQVICSVLNPNVNPVDSYCIPITSHLLREHFPKLRVLLAEDNEINQIVAKKILNEMGCNVIVANNGKEALDKFKTQSFDLILMDVHMPEMDGFEATSIIRKMESSTGNHTPIIALTANAIKGDRERCLAAGMDGYVAKPFQTQALLDAIQSLITITSNAQLEKVEKQLKQELLHTQIDDIDHILDRDTINDRLSGDIDLLNKVIDLFTRQYPSQIQAIEQAIEVKDSKLLHETAHALKGAIGNFTQKSAYQCAYALEKMGRENDFTQAKNESEKLHSEVLRLENALRTLAQGGL